MSFSKQIKFHIEISTEYALENEEIWDISKNADNSIIARWTLNDKTLTISGNGTMKDWEDNTEDDWHKKYENAIKKVIVEGNIINLGDYAFENCNSLENVVLTEEYFLVVRN